MGYFKGIKKLSLNKYNELKAAGLLDADVLYCVPGVEPMGVNQVEYYADLPTPAAEYLGVIEIVLNETTVGDETAGLYVCLCLSGVYQWKKTIGQTGGDKLDKTAEIQKLAVVDALPAAPEATTLYFIKE